MPSDAHDLLARRLEDCAQLEAPLDLAAPPPATEQITNRGMQSCPHTVKMGSYITALMSQFRTLVSKSSVYYSVNYVTVPKII